MHKWWEKMSSAIESSLPLSVGEARDHSPSGNRSHPWDFVGGLKLRVEERKKRSCVLPGPDWFCPVIMNRLYVEASRLIRKAGQFRYFHFTLQNLRQCALSWVCNRENQCMKWATASVPECVGSWLLLVCCIMNSWRELLTWMHECQKCLRIYRTRDLCVS